MILQTWPKIPLSTLAGRSAEQVAAEPAGRVSALAAILLVELSSVDEHQESDFNDLRRQLGLPTADPIDPATLDLSRVSLARLGRLIPSRLSDEQLLEVYHRVLLVGASHALVCLALEIVARETLDSKVDRAEVFGILAQLEDDPARALSYVEKGRDAAEAAGQSTAPWDLRELGLQMGFGNIERAQQVLNHLRAVHMKEPGVAEGVYRIFLEAGLINPDGTPVGPPPQSPPSIVLPGEQPASTSGIWTPDSPVGAGGSPSRLWTPGRE